MGLNDYRVAPTIAVSDTRAAREFYEGNLGLSDGEEQPDGGVLYRCAGGSTIHVYPSPENAGKSGATLAYWHVDDIEKVVDELASRGTSFEHYDFDGLKTNDKGIAEMGDDRHAWMRDPDGNILAIYER